MGDVLMRSELFSVVEGDGAHEVADRLEATHGCPLCCVGAYHAWERGLNENTNGLIRDFFPRRGQTFYDRQRRGC